MRGDEKNASRAGLLGAARAQQRVSLSSGFLFGSAGAGRTGTFCALSTVLERVKAEGILDVFQTVKSLRLQRPHMVQTLVRAAEHPAHTPCSSGPVDLSEDALGAQFPEILEKNFLG